MISALLKYFPAVFRQLAKICGIPFILAESGVPVILAPNGTIAADGTITLVTALPTTYSGGAWVRLPAGAVSGGSAGLYWAVFSSTTVGRVYINFVDPSTRFVPYIPSGTLTAATGSGSAYTQTTGADITLANYTIPGGVMGQNGSIRVKPRWSCVNTANAKTGKCFFGGTVAMFSNSLVNGGGYSSIGTVTNRGAQDKQVCAAYSDGSTGPSTYLSIDTSAAVSLTVTANIAAATDFVTVEAVIVEVLPS